MFEIMERALRTSKADYTEIRIQERQATRIAYRGSQLETAHTVFDEGGIVRCLCHGGGWGIAVLDGCGDLVSQVDRAYQCARLARGRPIALCPAAGIHDTISARQTRDVRGVSLAEKTALLGAYSEILLEQHESIVDTRTQYSDAFSRTYLASTDGTLIQQEQPSVRVSFAAVARCGHDVQFAGASRAGTRGFEIAVDLHDLARAAAQRAVEMLDARPVVGGRYSVVLNPQLAGVLIHESFGHLVEADAACENPKAREGLTLGQRIGSDALTVFDDGSLPGLRGTQAYDDEGTPAGRSDLIRNGILVGRLHSRETAARMGKAPTGNARAASYRHSPAVRMTNTAIEGGSVSFQDMLKDVELGIYACDSLGGQTTLHHFAFSPAYAFMIRNGQIAERVRDVVLRGSLFAALNNVDAIGSDFVWSRAGGTCAKRQGRLPVGFGAPHVRIRDVVVGG